VQVTAAFDHERLCFLYTGVGVQRGAVFGGYPDLFFEILGTYLFVLRAGDICAWCIARNYLGSYSQQEMAGSNQLRTIMHIHKAFCESGH
jgi:hypothetical protein